MPDCFALFDIPVPEEPIERSFSTASSVNRDGSSIESRRRRVDNVRDVFETVRANDQHAGW